MCHVPDFIDDDVGVYADAVYAVEGKVVGDMLQCFYFGENKDA